MGRASCGCTISMRSILTLSKMWDADAKFAKRVSSNTRKGKMQMQFIHDRQAEKHLQVQRKASCRCVGPQKEHLQQRTSSQCRYNSCHKEHLQQRISRACRYISYQKSKSLITSPISITVHHKARKDYAIQRIGVGLHCGQLKNFRKILEFLQP